MSFTFAQRLDRYLTTPPDQDNCDWWEAVFEELSEEAWERVEYIEDKPFFVKWMDHLQYIDIGYKKAARIIERAVKLYKL